MSRRQINPEAGRIPGTVLALQHGSIERPLSTMDRVRKLAGWCSERFRQSWGSTLGLTVDLARRPAGRMLNMFQPVTTNSTRAGASKA